MNEIHLQTIMHPKAHGMSAFGTFACTPPYPAWLDEPTPNAIGTLPL